MNFLVSKGYKKPSGEGVAFKKGGDSSKLVKV